jgi:hypothetical protein
MNSRHLKLLEFLAPMLLEAALARSLMKLAVESILKFNLYVLHFTIYVDFMGSRDQTQFGCELVTCIYFYGTFLFF